FDKTGTLTLGRPRLVDPAGIEPDMLAVAAALGSYSRHPLSQAIALHASGGKQPVDFDDVSEIPGFGIEGRAGRSVWRLGRAGWALGQDEAALSSALPGTILARDG